MWVLRFVSEISRSKLDILLHLLFMDGIKILPEMKILGGSSLLEVIFGWSNPTTVKTCLHGLPKCFFDVWVNKIHK